MATLAIFPSGNTVHTSPVPTLDNNKGYEIKELPKIINIFEKYKLSKNILEKRIAEQKRKE